MIDDSSSSFLHSSTPHKSVPKDFVALAKQWYPDLSTILLTFVWRGYDLLTAELPAGVDKRDLERSISQSLEPRIRRVMSGDEPFYIQHGPYERESMLQPPAQPPQYDLAFVFRADERLMWPLEAKVLKTDISVGDYVNELRHEFLTCRYAPFSSEAAMIAYLLGGKPTRVFQKIANKVPCTLLSNPDFTTRPCRISDHNRSVKLGKYYPAAFRCHHLVFLFPSFASAKKRRKRKAKQ